MGDLLMSYYWGISLGAGFLPGGLTDFLGWSALTSHLNNEGLQLSVMPRRHTYLALQKRLKKLKYSIDNAISF